MSPQPVQRRLVIYCPGFDPRGPRHYRRLYRKQAALYSGRSGIELQVSDMPREDRQWLQWQVHNASDEVTVDYHCLDWSPLIRRYWYESLPSLLRGVFQTLGQYVRCGFLGRVRREAALTGWAFLITLSYLFIALLVASVAATAAAVWLQQAVSGPIAEADWQWLAGAGLLALIAYLMWRHEHRLGARWLMRIAVFCARYAQGRIPQIDSYAEQVTAYIERVAKTKPYDELLLVGHSVGTLLAIAVRARWQQQADADTQPLACLTLGECIPLSSFLPQAQQVHRHIRLAAAHKAPWLDVTAPPDGACFALYDFAAEFADPAASDGRPRCINARFHTAFAADTYARVKRDKFNLHFQYLMAAERPAAYNYFVCSAGPDALDAGTAWSATKPHAP